MKRNIHKSIAVVLSTAMAISCMSFLSVPSLFSSMIPNYIETVDAASVPIKENIETTASNGMIIVGVEGKEYTSDMQTLLNRINAVRKEACDKHYPDPRDPSKILQSSDYVEMQIGEACMKTAVIRAAEASIRMNHARPRSSGELDALDVIGHFVKYGSHGENLAWSAIHASSIEGWINEKDDWIKFKDSPGGGQVGHYKTLINPDMKFTGMSTFNPINDSAPYDWCCTAGAYSSSDVPLNTLPGAQNTQYIQKMEIPVSSVINKDITGDSILYTGTTSDYELLVAASFSGVRANTVVDCPVYSGVSWSSDNPDILSIDENGMATAKTVGSVKITATIGGQSVTRDIVVVPDGTTVVSVANPPVVTTESNKVPVLTKTVEATLSNGSKITIDTRWDTYDTSELLTHFTGKDIDVNGTAGGFPITQRIHVNAAKIEKVYPSKSSVTTNCGSLPEEIEVKVDLSNGYTWKYPSSWNSSYFTVWDRSGLEQCNISSGGDFTITGYLKLTTENGLEKFPISVSLHVNPGTSSNNMMNDVPVAGNDVDNTSGGGNNNSNNGGGGNIGNNTGGGNSQNGGSSSSNQGMNSGASSSGNGNNSGSGSGSTNVDATPTPTVEITTPAPAAPTYSNEWVNGEWYDENGNNTYSGTLSWKSNGSGWWVEDSAGWYPVSCWQKIDGEWYYFNSSGYMASSEWYDGYWFNGNGTWDSTYKLTWCSNSTGWWIEDISGWWPSNCWQKIDGSWYYFDASGYMVTSRYIDGYWIGANGVCQ